MTGTGRGSRQDVDDGKRETRGFEEGSWNITGAGFKPRSGDTGDAGQEDPLE